MDLFEYKILGIVFDYRTFGRFPFFVTKFWIPFNKKIPGKRCQGFIIESKFNF